MRASKLIGEHGCKQMAGSVVGATADHYDNGAAIVPVSGQVGERPRSELLLERFVGSHRRSIASGTKQTLSRTLSLLIKRHRPS